MLVYLFKNREGGVSFNEIGPLGCCPWPFANSFPSETLCESGRSPQGAACSLVGEQYLDGEQVAGALPQVTTAHLRAWCWQAESSWV